MNKKKSIILMICTLLLSFICIGSSPFLDYMDPDSQNFRLIGRALASGQVAYRDIFDHKGPYIFFINEIAAFITPHSEMGLFLMEFIAYAVSAILVFNIARYYCKDEEKAFLSSLAFMGVSFNFFTFVTGNLTDSWSVVFQLISVYLIFKYVKDDKVEHKPQNMFIHGICATIVLMMRPNNAGMWIPFGIVLAWRLFSNKRFKNFFINLGALILGVLTGCIPFIYYGFKHDCFEEMWFGMFTANFTYTANNASLARFPVFIKLYICQPAFLITLLGILSVIVIIKYVNNSYLKVTFVSMFICSLIFMNVSMRDDSQYSQLLMIFIMPFIIAFFNKLDKLFNIYIWVVAIIVLTIVANLQLIKQITKYGQYHYLYEAATEMKSIMDEDPSDMVLVTGCNSVLYNETGTLPHIKYFITYGGGLDYSNFPDAVMMQVDSVLSGENDYIMVHYTDNNQIYGITELDNSLISYLNDAYYVVFEQIDGECVRLYKRK